MSTVTVPVSLFHEAEGFVITIECRNGDLFRGTLMNHEDNFNCRLVDVTQTTASGEVHQMAHMFLRGSQIRFISVPPMLQNSPLFKRAGAKGLHRGTDQEGDDGSKPHGRR
ncbi:Like-Sm (LSM) domain containing protein, LSm4/SmD1/SmD3 [Kipferlia bialata]|uniref:Small nuclear ribonucleoprotein Sm D3 n=1 Tax=Kipferlia bialata TaxID=797122 RepID=A0A391P4K4_9EUKA|nr:Like-Sm (LSM) domain containing protein, LSm4/SmD1/SmD3 [Kipferlia bialata]|eukprot:g8625.t1